MTDVKTLHDADFVAWSKEQADAPRAAARTGANRMVGWDNVAEEIEDLGNSQKPALRSQLRRLIQHLLKLENSPAPDSRRRWIDSVTNARAEIDYLLEVSPSLRQELAAGIAAETRRAIGIVIRDLETYGETDRAGAARIRATAYTADQIPGDWFPPPSRG